MEALISGRLSCNYVSKLGGSVKRVLSVRLLPLKWQQASKILYLTRVFSYSKTKSITLDILIFKILALELFTEKLMIELIFCREGKNKALSLPAPPAPFRQPLRHFTKWSMDYHFKTAKLETL